MTDRRFYDSLKSRVDEAGKGSFSVKAVCQILDLNKGNYYDYIKRPESTLKARRNELLKKIQRICTDSKEIYGAPKITRILRREGEQVSQRLVGSIIKENGLRSHYAQPWTQTTKDCDFSKELENILAREFSSDSPNRVWSTDITYGAPIRVF